MLFPRLFWAIVVALILLIIAAQRPLPGENLFSISDVGQRLPLQGLYFSELYAGKLAHAANRPRYSIGLFGNSRSVALSHPILGTANSDYYNFSILGASPRANVLLVEELNLIKKLPKRVFFSFDHFELEQFMNPSVAGLGKRLTLVFREIQAGLTKDFIAPKELLSAVWRQVYVAGQDIRLLFDFSRFINGLEWWLRHALGGRAWGEIADVRSLSGWAKDGSYGTRVPESGANNFALMQPEPATILPGYLEWDMERLAAVAQDGVELVVYESLLDPLNGEHYTKAPSSHALIMRKRWLAACQRLQLTCIPFNPAWLTNSPYAWGDPSHPPPDVLAAYLHQIIGVIENRPAQ